MVVPGFAQKKNGLNPKPKPLNMVLNIELKARLLENELKPNGKPNPPNGKPKPPKPKGPNHAFACSVVRAANAPAEQTDKNFLNLLISYIPR